MPAQDRRTPSKAIDESGEIKVRNAVIKALMPFQTESGGYVMRNTFRYLVSRRPAGA